MEQVACFGGLSDKVRTLVSHEMRLFAGCKQVEEFDVSSNQRVRTSTGQGNMKLDKDGSVYSMHVIASKNMIVCGRHSGKIQLIDLTNLQIVSELEGHTNTVKSFTTISDDILLSGSYDKTVRVWDLKKMREVTDTKISSFEHKGYVNALYYNPRSKKLYAASTNMSVFDFELGKVAKKVSLEDKNQHKDEVLGFACKKGDILFTCSSDTTVKAFDMKLNKSVNTMKGHTQSVPCIDSSSTSIFSASADGSLVRWAIDGYYQEETVQAHNDPIRALNVVHETLVATGAQDNSVKLWHQNE
jgi:WD40 repeat protein